MHVDALLPHLGHEDLADHSVEHFEHALFEGLGREFRIHLARQADGDLGRKMWCALRDGLGRSGAAGIMGCDVPHCREEILEQAYEHLSRGHNVIGPAEDGGYYFIGLCQPSPALFKNIDWGSARVVRQTLARAKHLNVDFERLPRLRDLDTADDLWLVARHYLPLQRFVG